MRQFIKYSQNRKVKIHACIIHIMLLQFLKEDADQKRLYTHVSQFFFN